MNMFLDQRHLGLFRLSGCYRAKIVFHIPPFKSPGPQGLRVELGPGIESQDSSWPF